MYRFPEAKGSFSPSRPQMVLVAQNLEMPTPWAWHYAINLAARLRLPLVMLGILPPGAEEQAMNPIAEGLAGPQSPSLKKIFHLCQKEGVNLEILLASGPFFPEVKRVLTSGRAFRFLVMGLPKEATAAEMGAFSGFLREVHRFFPGKILLVREQGKLAQPGELEPRSQRRKS